MEELIYPNALHLQIKIPDEQFDVFLTVLSLNESEMSIETYCSQSTMFEVKATIPRVSKDAAQDAINYCIEQWNKLGLNLRQ